MILNYEYLSKITFTHPEAFGILLIYFVALFVFKEKINSLYFSNIAMLPTTSAYKSIFLKVLKFLILFFMVVALANPMKQDEIVTHTNKGYEISIVLDSSISMLENNKFTITKEILSDFIEKRKSDRLALSVFADYPYLLSPMTYDKQSLSKLLDLLEVGIAGQRETAVYEALFFSTNLFKGSNSKNKIAILLTDGIDNTNTVPLDIAIKRATDAGIKVYTIGIGGIGDYNGEALKKIASKTGGKFYEASSKQKMQHIYKEIDSLEKSEIKTDRYVQKTYFYQYPLYVAFGLLSLFLILQRRAL